MKLRLRGTVCSRKRTTGAGTTRLAPVVLLFMVLFLFSPQVAFTQTLGQENDTIVVVTAYRETSPDLLPVQELSGRQLERLRSHSVADAVRFFSGVQVKDYGGVGGLKTVNIRGMGTQHVGVFFDGIELGNAQNGQVDLGRFSLEEMQSVTVYNGQRSQLLQPARDFGSASTVYLRSRTPDFSNGKDFQGHVSMKAGSFGTFRPSFTIDKKLSNAVGTSLSAGYVHTDGSYSFRYKTQGGYDTTATRCNSRVDALRAETGFFGKTSQGEWRAKAYFYSSERGLPGAVVRNRFAHEDKQWDTNLFVQSQWKQRVAKNYSFLLSGKLAYDYLRYTTNPKRDASEMFIDNSFYQTEAYLSAANMLSLGRWQLAAALDYQYNHVSGNQLGFAYPTRNTLLASAAANASFGTMKIHAALLATFVNDRVRNGGQSMKDRLEWSPSIVMTWQPTKELPVNFRAFYKRIFRMPTLNDLYYTLIGRADLNPERTDQFNIGATYEVRKKQGFFRGLELSADGYINHVKDKIVAVPTANQFRWTMMNIGRVRIRGIDFVAQTYWAVSQFTIDVRAAYTYQRAADRTDRNDVCFNDQIPYIPKHSGSLTIGLGWRNVEAHYSFIYTGERYNQRANILENYEPAWYTSDVGVSFRVRPFIITAEVNNIFNQKYEVVRGYPMPGTNFLIGLKWKF